MKLLCSNCFNSINNINKNIAKCNICNQNFNLTEKSNNFRIKSEGGYIKDSLKVKEIIELIKNGKILESDYIATENGPWIPIYESSFIKYIPKSNKDKDISIMLYQKKKLHIITITTLIIFLILSFGLNICLIILMNIMKYRIESLINKITGG